MTKILDPRLAAFLQRCDAFAEEIGVKRSSLSTTLFADGKRLDQIAAGGSDVGIGRLAEAEAALSAMESRLQGAVAAGLPAEKLKLSLLAA